MDRATPSPISSIHRSLSEEDSDCCGKSGSSLEDTVSLTCDESQSLTSSISSSSMVDNTIDEENSDSEIETYRSPLLLRKRLMPLPPSPIINAGPNTTILRKRSERKALWTRRPQTIRMLWFTLALTAYFLGLSTNYRSALVETLRDHTLGKEAREWRRFFRRRAPKIMQKVSSKAPSHEYTIRIRGHRVDLVTQSLDFHAQCPSVKDVQIEWTDASTKLPTSLSTHRSGKINTLGKPHTQAVLLLDEDLILPCQDIERGELVLA